MSRSAFSLLEIVVVIGIIVMLASIATPGIQNYRSSIALQAEARRVVNDLRTAQDLAVSEQVVHYLEAAPSTATYRLYRNDATPTLLKTVSLENPITIADVTGPADGRFRYNSYGAVSTAGTIVLENENGETYTITVRPSGYVHLE